MRLRTGYDHLTNGPLELVGLSSLMALTSGTAEIVVGLLDGPVKVDHPDFAASRIRSLPEGPNGECAQPRSTACQHGTFVAGILAASRGSLAPAICPDCTLVLRPIFVESTTEDELLPSATPEELAEAIAECIDNGARVLNLSAGMFDLSMRDERGLCDVLDYAAGRGVVVAAAAGNQGTLGSSTITRHPWVIPVAGFDSEGRPSLQSNLGNSMGKRGVGAPSENVTSLGTDGQALTLSGTSFATPFVTGTIALLWSLFPDVTAAEIKVAITHSHGRRNSVVPPLLNAGKAHQMLSEARSEGVTYE